jgi:hypothetical protein
MYQKTGSDDVYLMFTHNYENDNYSPLQEFKTSVDSVANDHKDRFILLDDQNDTHEMTRLAKNSSGAAETTYRMNFKLARNTDGGIIGPFSENRFAVRVWNTQLTVDHRKGTYFYSNDGQAPVKMNDPTEQFAVRYVWEPCSQ